MTRNRRTVRAGLAAATAVAVVFGPVAGQALAEPAGTESAVVDRSLGLSAVQNARDAGGYVTTDGHRVRTGLVFRTGALDKATPEDLARLSALGVRVVDDLRTGYERALGPDKLPAGAVGHSYDVIGQASPLILAGALVGGEGMYRAFITAPGANEAFAAVLRDIIAADGAGVLFHCSAGKDRTGWASAVLLTVLGVDRATVTADYLASNTYRNAAPTDPLNGVQQSWLDGAFDQVDQSYGSFDNYVRAGLGLTEDEVAALRSALLS
ncbi:protein-tyrosine-phosphatase [Nocardia neocaledoniensis NBRC 108232]|uniref:Protein-tyrosine phosphatase n=1 Tax=Nocardia neocaledoniensis TaxID=236511 RepID=A0A317P0S9_9NOCA|nr:tyrosine-protein phosphatase [Nocardia neocaledoniensis]PWV81080.1 protein-tyrosine phosphatase [Nocardia neocaledoniensis]GEM34368.1 protein-tyrosine-phosphatase [Nocardia neocaledoniensis NBRC 108232]